MIPSLPIVKMDGTGGTPLCLVLAFLGVFLSSCVTTREASHRATPPEESEFVKIKIPIPGTSRVYPTWHTPSPGCPVLLLHAVNGLTPDLLEFALLLEDWGYRAYVPALFGHPFANKHAFGNGRMVPSLIAVSASARWDCASTEHSGIVVDDTAALSRHICEKEGCPVAVIGNSFSGHFPLAILDDPSVRLAVVGQPSLPVKTWPQLALRLPHTPYERRSLLVSNEKWNDIVTALRKCPKKQIVGFHYVEDPMAPVERFDELHERLSCANLSDRFTAYVMTPPGDCYAEERRSWVVSTTTTEKMKHTTPHSTFLDGKNERDLGWFRSRLREALARSW